MQYKCPNCDGLLEYRADMRMFGCSSCPSVFSDEEVKKMFKDSGRPDISGKSDQNISEVNDIDVYLCTECGAEIMTVSDIVPGACTYCQSSLAFGGRISENHLPYGVIPFQMNAEKAAGIIKEKLEKKKFIPSELLSEESLENIKGVYIPFWMADCQASGSLEGTAKRLRTWRKGDFRFTETKEYTIEREAGISFSGITAEDDGQKSRDIINALEPFDFENVQNFSSSHLSGYRAERYMINKGKAFSGIKKNVTDISEQIMNASVSGYSGFSEADFRVSIMNTDWRYILLPVWLMTYQYNGKIYKFAVNDMNGKMTGRPPIALKALFYVSAAILLVVMAAVLAGFYIFQKNISGALIPAAVAALATSGIFFAFVLRRYKKKEEITPVNRSPEHETKFRISDDKFCCQHTSKVRIE